MPPPREVWDTLLPWIPAVISWTLLPVFWLVGLLDWWLVLSAGFWTLIGWQGHRSRIQMRSQLTALRRHLLATTRRVIGRAQPLAIAVDDPLFCPKCHIDLQANPGAQVELLDIDEPFLEIQGRCDCGAHSFWTYWPDQHAAAGKVWMEGGQVRGTGW